jgi:NAD+ synthase
VNDLVPRADPEAPASIGRFLKEQVAESAAHGVVLGVSGGIDSALALRLARDALGPSRVRALLMPDDRYPSALREETIGYVNELGVAWEEIGISRIESAFETALPAPLERLDQGNIKARIRMTLLYARARSLGNLVVGTGNRSELLLGYFTKFGDGGADLLPLARLYKTEVRDIAGWLDLPRPVRERPPTAGLWEGQTDEGELGLPYSAIDPILVGLERGLSISEIVERTGRTEPEVRSIAERVRRHRHKREPPRVPP